MTADGNQNGDSLESFSRSIDEALRTVQNLHLSQLATAFYQASALQWALAVRLNRSQWTNSTYADHNNMSTISSQFSSYSPMFQLGSYDYHKINQATLPTPGTMPAANEDAQSGPIDLTNAPNSSLPQSANVSVSATSIPSVVQIGVSQPPRKRQRKNSASDPSRVRFHVVLLESSAAREKPTNNRVRQLTAYGLGRPNGVKEPIEMSVFTSASDLKDRLTALYPEYNLGIIEFDACYADKDGQLTVLPLDSFRYLATAIGDEGCLYLRPKVDIPTAPNKMFLLGQTNKDTKIKRTNGEKIPNGTETSTSSLLDPSVRDQIVLQTRWRGSCTRRTHICECDICGVKFTRKDSLTRHSRKHSGKSYECKACGKCFAENYYYKRHKCRNVASANHLTSNSNETKQGNTNTEAPNTNMNADSATPSKMMDSVSPSTVNTMVSNSPSERSSVYNYDSSESVGVPCTSGGESGSSVSLSGEEKGE